MAKKNEKWDESRMVYCTGGRYPLPRMPEFSPRAGNLVGKYGCSHYKTDSCTCPCHTRKKSHILSVQELKNFGHRRFQKQSGEALQKGDE